MTYRYNTFTQQCSRRPMNETFRKVGVTATAEFIDTFVIGTNAIEKFGVTVNIWGDNGGRNGEFLTGPWCVRIASCILQVGSSWSLWQMMVMVMKIASL